MCAEKTDIDWMDNSNQLTIGIELNWDKKFFYKKKPYGGLLSS